MERREVIQTYRMAFTIFVLLAIGGLSFAAGLIWSIGHAQAAANDSGKEKGPRIVYPKKSQVDLDGMSIEGEIQRPGEFYFQHKPQEKFDSLVKRRANFHREMLRDAVLNK